MTQGKPNKTHTSTTKPDARELNLNELESVSGGGHKTGKTKTKPAEFVIFRLSQFSGGGGSAD